MNFFKGFRNTRKNKSNGNVELLEIRRPPMRYNNSLLIANRAPSGSSSEELSNMPLPIANNNYRFPVNPRSPVNRRSSIANTQTSNANLNRREQRRLWNWLATRKAKGLGNTLGFHNVLRRFESGVRRRPNSSLSLFNNNVNEPVVNVVRSPGTGLRPPITEVPKIRLHRPTGSIPLLNNNNVVEPAVTVVRPPINEPSMSEFAGTGLRPPITEVSNTRLRNTRRNRVSSENMLRVALFGHSEIPTANEIINALNNLFIPKVFEYIIAKKQINMSYLPLTRENYSTAKSIAKNAKPGLIARGKIAFVMKSAPLIARYVEQSGLDANTFLAIKNYYDNLRGEDVNKLIEAVKYYVCQYIRAYEARNSSVGRSEHCP